MEPITMVVTTAAMLAARVMRALGRTGAEPAREPHRPLARWRRRAAAERVSAEPAALADLNDLDLAGDAGRSLLAAVGAARGLLGVDAARLLLAGADGCLRWATAVDRHGAPVADRHRRPAHGPSLAAFADARPVAVGDLRTDRRWAALGRQLPDARVRSTLSVPIETAAGPAPIGVLELSCAGPRPWDEAAVAVARTYAAVLGLLLTEARAAAAARELAGQLRHALRARIRVEQAKGVLMAREGLGELAAWERLRRAARDTRRPVDVVARELLAGIDPPTGPAPPA
jgi:GAF domain-containing protein